jgi:hypothetical protein
MIIQTDDSPRKIKKCVDRCSMGIRTGWPFLKLFSHTGLVVYLFPFFFTMAELARASPAKSSRQDRARKREAGRFTYMLTKWRLLLVNWYANLAVLSMHACPVELFDSLYSVWRTTVWLKHFIVGQVATGQWHSATQLFCQFGFMIYRIQIVLAREISLAKFRILFGFSCMSQKGRETNQRINTTAVSRRRGCNRLVPICVIIYI